jgi:hypothetical protein
MTQEFPKPPTAQAKRWMLNEARRLRADGKIGKQADLLSRCKKDTGCTNLDALAAYKNLPDELIRRPGKPPKARGCVGEYEYAPAAARSSQQRHSGSRVRLSLDARLIRY